MGFSTIAGQPTSATRFLANSNIAAGDLLLNSAVGGVVIASPTLSVANNNTTGALNFMGTTRQGATSSVNYGDNNLGNRICVMTCQLSNGNIVQPIAGNATTQNATLSFYLRGLQGQFQQAFFPTLVTNDTVTSYRTRKINTSNFVIAWCTTANILKFAVYTNTGTVVQAETVIGNMSGSTSNLWSIDCTTGGNIVFSYSSSTGSGFSYIAIRSSTGASVLGETNIDSTASSNYHSIVPMANGNFCVRWNAGTLHRFAIYTSTGSVVSATATYCTGAAWTTGGNDLLATQTPAGPLVLIGNLAGVPNAYVVSITGTITISAFVPNGTIGGFANSAPAVNQTNVGWCYAGLASANNSIITAAYSELCLPLTSPFSQSAAFAGSNLTNLNVGVLIYSLGLAGFVTMSTQSTFAQTAVCPCTGQITYYNQVYLNVAQRTPTGAVSNSINPLTFFNGSTSAQPAVTGCFGQFSMQLLSDGSVANLFNIPVTSNQTGQTAQGAWMSVYRIPASSIVGVALEAATKNDFVRVGTSGAYSINQTFPQSASFDRRTSDPQGTKGTILFNKAVLTGLV